LPIEKNTKSYDDLLLESNSNKELLGEATHNLDTLNNLMNFLQNDLEERTNELHKARNKETALEKYIEELQQQVNDLSLKLASIAVEGQGSVRRTGSPSRTELIALKVEVSKLKRSLEEAHEALEAKNSELNTTHEDSEKLHKVLEECLRKPACSERCMRKAEEIKVLKEQLDMANREIKAAYNKEERLEKQLFVSRAIRNPNNDIEVVLHQREQVTALLVTAEQQVQEKTGELEKIKQMAKARQMNHEAYQKSTTLLLDRREEEIRNLREKLEYVLKTTKLPGGVPVPPGLDGVFSDNIEPSSSSGASGFEPVDPIVSDNESANDSDAIEASDVSSSSSSSSISSEEDEGDDVVFVERSEIPVVDLIVCGAPVINEAPLTNEAPVTHEAPRTNEAPSDDEGLVNIESLVYNETPFANASPRLNEDWIDLKEDPPTVGTPEKPVSSVSEKSKDATEEMSTELKEANSNAATENNETAKIGEDVVQNKDQATENHDKAAKNDDKTASNDNKTASNDNKTAGNDDKTAGNNNKTVENDDKTVENDDKTVENDDKTVENDDKTVENDDTTTENNDEAAKHKKEAVDKKPLAAADSEGEAPVEAESATKSKDKHLTVWEIVQKLRTSMPEEYEYMEGMKAIDLE
jgi:hypothetical protein